MRWNFTTGLYHMGARFYDPAIGRWLSEDPVQDNNFEPATLNFYAYVYGNPVMHVDPDGRFGWLAPIVIGLNALAARFGPLLVSQAGNIRSGSGLGLGAAAATLLAAAPRGSEVIIALSRTKGEVYMNAQLAVALSEKWTSVRDFIGHFHTHMDDIAMAFGRASITAQEYAAIAREAFSLAGGRVGIHTVSVMFDGARAWVTIFIGEKGIVTVYAPFLQY